MEKIIVHIRPINWTQGEVYSMAFKITGEQPAVRINWGDRTIKTYYGHEIIASHIYPKDATLSFIIEAEILSGQIDYCDSSGGDCSHELVDFSQAPSIKRIDCEMFEKVIFDNPALETLSLSIALGANYDLSKLPNLKKLEFDGCDPKMKCLDLSNCHNIEYLQCWCYNTPDLQLIVPNDVPLEYIDIRGNNFSRGLLATLHRIIEQTEGEIVGEFENDEDDEE